MAYWIFKLAKQELYHDVPGQKYVYDNTHSVRVAPDDVFLYLDKSQGYAFTATGSVQRLTKRKPTKQQSRRSSRVTAVFTACLADLIWFKRPLSISPLTRTGKSNRAKLGIVDVNRLGWSQSMPSLGDTMYQAIVDLADAEKLVPSSPGHDDKYYVPDSWGKAKTRTAMSRFSAQVMYRSNSTCVVCGTTLPAVVEAAHLSPYAADQSNRANPSNGVCLCAYCHRALDRRTIAIQPNGELLVCPSVDDVIAKAHFSRVSPETRKQWLRDVNPNFLKLTVKWFNETLSNRGGRSA